MRDEASMHVLYVLFRFPQVSQTFVRDEIWALRRIGLRVDVISLEDPGEDRPDNSWAGPYSQVGKPSALRALRDLAWCARRRPRALLRLLRFAAEESGRRRYLLARIPSLARRLSRDPPSHVHTHFVWDTATVAAGLATLIDCPGSITVHAKDIYAQPPRQIRRRLRAFAQVITVCHFNVGYLAGRQLLGADARPARMIACGVALCDVPAPQPSVDVVAVGRLVDKKGFDLLLLALSTLDSEIQFGYATVVGDGPERGRLEALSVQLGLSSRVTFAGALPHDQTLRRIGAGRVLCLPSRQSPDGDSDAMPVAIREAMAHGVPVIASRLAGIPESVDDEVGWLVDPGSVTSLTRALSAALTDEAMRDAKAERARARAVQRWSFDDQARDLLAVFQSSRSPRQAISQSSRIGF